MAAIDPSAAPEHTGTANGDVPERATLKIVYDPQSPDEDEDDSDGSDEDETFLKGLLAGRESEDEDEDEEDESSSDEEDKNGGPSDPLKTKKARKEAAVKELMNALANQDESDDEMEVDSSAGTNGIKAKPKANKGKAKALPSDPEEDEDSEQDSDEPLDGMEELVICTLDPGKVIAIQTLTYNPISYLCYGHSIISKLWTLQFPKANELTSRFLARMPST